MGRRPLSSYPPEVAAKMRADYAQKQREAWAKREENGLGARLNGAKRDDVRARIAESVKQRWEEGAYVGRVNGMSGKRASQNANWQWGKNQFREILTQFEPVACSACGATEEVNTHHVDESHDNYLLSNLAWYCVPCHLHLHHYEKTSRTRRPVIRLARSFAFEYAHILPWHPGKCNRLHGHSGHIEVEVAGRLDPNGVVLDFGDLGKAAKASVVEPLDHRFLNDFLGNPTSEEMLVWAWTRLESIAVKGLERITFRETDTSSATLTKAAMLDAYGWDFIDDEWRLVARWDALPQEDS
jgi:6-pyruvoyltetrahydropterin/6-carboxytetrahydropterin synthase